MRRTLSGRKSRCQVPAGDTSAWGDPKLPRTAGDPEGEATPSIRGADSVLAGTAVRTHRPKRGAAVFHCHALDVPRRSLGPALQAVDFDSVRRCGHGQLLHRLASIQLWPTPLQRSRALFCSIVAPKAQVARQGGDTPGQSRFNRAGLSAGSPLTQQVVLSPACLVPAGQARSPPRRLRSAQHSAGRSGPASASRSQ